MTSVREKRRIRYQNNNNRIKKHVLYNDIFNSCRVCDLRIIVKMKKNTIPNGFHKMKKSDLVCFIVSNSCAFTITRFVRNCRSKYVPTLTDVEGERRCPISLINISELEEDDKFTHDNITFSKSYIIDFFKSNYDFTNPITRNEIGRDQIIEIDCEELLVLYDDRISLREQRVTDINDFAFHENEIEYYFYKLILLESNTYTSDEDSDYIQISGLFHQTWRNMAMSDKNRTVCVLKSLRDKLDGWFYDLTKSSVRKKLHAGRSILDRYDMATSIMR